MANNDDEIALKDHEDFILHVTKTMKEDEDKRVKDRERDRRSASRRKTRSPKPSKKSGSTSSERDRADSKAKERASSRRSTSGSATRPGAVAESSSSMSRESRKKNRSLDGSSRHSRRRSRDSDDNISQSERSSERRDRESKRKARRKSNDSVTTPGAVAETGDSDARRSRERRKDERRNTRSGTNGGRSKNRSIDRSDAVALKLANNGVAPNNHSADGSVSTAAPPPTPSGLSRGSYVGSDPGSSRVPGHVQGSDEATILVGEQGNNATEGDVHLQAVAVDEQGGNKAQQAEIERLRQQMEEMQQNQNENAEQQKDKRDYRKWICAVVLLLAVGGGVAGYVLGTQGSDEGNLPPPVVLPNSTSAPTEEDTADTTPVPTINPTNAPTKLQLFDQPSDADCDDIASGSPVQGEENLDQKNFAVEFETTLLFEMEENLWLSAFKESLQSIFVPELAGCQTTPNRRLRSETASANLVQGGHRRLQLPDYLIANGIIGDLVLDPSGCKEDSGVLCFKVRVDMDLWLRGEAREFLISGYLAQIFRERAVEKLGLETIMSSVVIISANPSDPTNQPSNSPTSSTSAEPTLSPTTSPLVHPRHPQMYHRRYQVLHLPHRSLPLLLPHRLRRFLQ